MARKSRKNQQEVPLLIEEKTWRTAVYARLSIEDCRDTPESDTIDNQVLMIEQYISERPFLKLSKVYKDNGETGTNFDRPGFERLMHDVKMGLINCIVVKDLSRFGRNYIEAGDYIEKIFPFMGVRFIAITDGYDSENGVDETETLILSLKNLINDIYAKDISKKIISALSTKQKNGDFIGAFAPFGYKKSEQDKHKLVIDEQTAPIVRDIFRWRLEGMGYSLIVRKLNEAEIPSPISRRISSGEIKNSSYYKNLLWQNSAVKKILHHGVYIGHMVQGLTKKALCDNLPKERKLPKSEWIIVENTHEPLIDKDTWDRVQEINMSRREESDKNRGKYPSNSENLFKGLLVCADCGSKMIRYKNVTKAGKLIYGYICQIRSQNLDLVCTSKFVREDILFEFVYAAIAQQIELASDIESTIERLNNQPSAKKTFFAISRKINDATRKLNAKKALKSRLYESYVDNIIDEAEYIYSKNKYTAEIESLQNELEELNRLKITQSETLTPKNKWIAAFKRFKDEKELSREMVTELIERIVVSGYNDMEIVWNFNGDYMKVCEYSGISPIASTSKSEVVT